MADFCKNCNTELSGKLCSDCGQEAILERINGQYIKSEIKHLLHFEKGLFYTIKELLIRPGKSVRTFLTENRNRLVKPIFFIIVTSLIYTLVSQYFQIEEQYVNYDVGEFKTTGVILKWIQDNYGYSNILMGVFIAFFVNFFFKKYNFNFYEILILLCFVMGFAMLIGALFALLQGLIHFDLMGIAGILFMIYATFAIADFYDRTKPANYVKAFISYLLGMIIFIVLIVFSGIIIDLILM